MSDTSTITRRVTAVELLAWLLANRYITNTGFIVDDALIMAGATRQELDSALSALAYGSGPSAPIVARHLSQPAHVPDTSVAAPPPPPVASAPEPVAAPEPTPPRRPRRGGRLRMERFTDDGVHLLHCSGPCDGWLTTDAFMPRLDRPGTFSSRCRACRALYQRARHVKIATIAALEEIGVKIHLDEDSNIAGVACAKCGQPFQPGQDIHGSARFVHDVCPVG